VGAGSAGWRGGAAIETNAPKHQQKVQAFLRLEVFIAAMIDSKVSP
jgi:hypothetical protein